MVLVPKIKKIEPKEPKKNVWHFVAWGRLTVILVAVIFLVAGSIWFFSGSDLVVDNVVGGQLSQTEQELLLEKMAKHIKLPTGQYQMAMVVEPEKLKPLSMFYGDVKKDDIVVVYPNFALIYDERSDVLTNATILNAQ